MSINRDDVNERSIEKINELVGKVFLFKDPSQVGTTRFKARKNALIIYQFNPNIFAELVKGNYLDLGSDSFARSSILLFADINLSSKSSALIGQTSSVLLESLQKGGSPSRLPRNSRERRLQKRALARVSGSNS